MRTITGILGASAKRAIPFFICLVLLAACSMGVSDSDQLLKKLIREKQPGFVYDFANVVTPQDRNAISRLFNDLEARTSAQLKIVTLPSLEGGEIKDFSNRLYEGWGIGQKGKDNGALMLMSQQNRKIWIEVGYGLEGALPDAKVGRLLDQYVMPSFKQDDYSAGILKGAQALAAVVAQEYGVQLEGTLQPTAPGGGDKGRGRFSILHLLGVLILIYLFFRHPFLFFTLMSMGFGGGGRSSGGFGGGGFRGGGFGGGMSGGGGAGRSW
jgi:uncharacterized protein